MKYTETYRKIYDSVKNESIDHKDAHHVALRITDAINYLNLRSQNDSNILEVVKDVVSNLNYDGIIDKGN
jgi:hypothetical protein